MKFVVDAHFPYGFKLWLLAHGHDAIHTDDLPNKSNTSDREITEFADRENCIIITKDSDFRTYNILHGAPQRLLFVTTGNIVNRALFQLMDANFHLIESLFEQGKKVIEQQHYHYHP